MKRFEIKLIILVLTIFLLSLILEFTFSKDFIVFKKNSFLFSHKLKVSEIKGFIKTYRQDVNQFFWINRFSSAKIENEDLNIIVCKENFNEISNENIFYNSFLFSIKDKKNYLRRIFNIALIENFNYKYIWGINTIFLKYEKKSDLILTFHKHLIYKNLSEKLTEIYNIKSGIKPDYSIDFLEMLNDSQIGCFMIDSIESFFNFNLMVNDKDKFLIDEIKIKNYLTTYNNTKIPYKYGEELYIDIITDSLSDEKDVRLNLQNKFIASIIENYGYNKFSNFINYLYNNKIVSFNEIFMDNFGISFKEFIYSRLF